MSEESMLAFGRTCAAQNSVGEILDGLEVSAEGEFFYSMNETSLADCIDWDLTPLEWVRALNLALLFKLAEPVQSGRRPNPWRGLSRSGGSQSRPGKTRMASSTSAYSADAG